jgi:hypothetical protein
MGEIIHYDIISADCIEHVTGITKFNDKVFISSKASSKSFASYSIECTGKLRYDPSYYDLLSNDIRHVTTYNNFLVIIPKDSFAIFLVDPSGNDIVNLKVFNKISNTTESFKDYILNNTIFPSKINRDSLVLTACIINNKTVYFFVQSRICNATNRISNATNMFIIKGELCEDRLALTTNFKLLSYYNLYNVGRESGLSKKYSELLFCSGVTYNPDRHLFVFLLIYNSQGFNGILGTLDVLEGLDSVGGYIHPVISYSDNKSPLVFDDKPRGITYHKDDIYYVITNGMYKSKKHFTKYFIVKILNIV